MPSLPKQIQQGEELKKQILAIVEIVADTVCATLGPKGKTVVIEQKFGDPIITKDGVTVARSLEFADQIAQLTTQILKQASEQSNLHAGDATTTTIALARRLLVSSFESGFDPIEIKKFLEEIQPEMLILLRTFSHVATDEQLRHIGSISANDSKVGTFIANLLIEAGEYGAIAIEDSQEIGLKKKIIRGMEIQSGYNSSYFVNKIDALEAELKDTHVLVTDEKIHSTGQILPYLEDLALKQIKQLVIVARDFDTEVISFLIDNKNNNKFQSIAIKAPSGGEYQKEYLEDLCSLVGARLISPDTGGELAKLDLEALGFCRQVVARKDTTIFADGKGNVAERVQYLKNHIALATSDIDKAMLKTRLAKLNGAIGIIQVGCATNAERKELRYRIEDAILAVRAAKEEGVLTGGGVSLLRVRNSLTEKYFNHPIWPVVSKMLCESIHQLCSNAGKDAEKVLAIILDGWEKKKNYNIGYNVALDSFDDLLVTGVIDATKATCLAVQNAISVTGLLLNCDSFVYLDKENQTNLEGKTK